MATILRDLCKHAKEKFKMNQICGESNMNNLVNWVHMLEDPETASFLHGQELIFTTGIGHHDTHWLIDFAKQLVSYQASGLVLNIGPYIQSVPEELITYCKDKNFPLFTIPWSTRIVDITNDFCRKIINGEEAETTVAGAFKNAIFFPDNISEQRSILERKEFDTDGEFCIMALAIITESNDKFTEYEKILRLHLTKILFSINDRFSIFRQDKYLIVILQKYTMDMIESAIQRLYKICNSGEKDYRVFSGIGINDFGISSLHKNYKRALDVLHIAQSQNEDKLFYSDIGFYQLLIEIEDIQVLKRFYKDTLGALEDFDKKYNTDYLITLKSYLDHNASVQEVAKETFVHRNTINYKIKKIKEILSCDLDYKDGVKLLMAFNIKELL